MKLFLILSLISITLAATTTKCVTASVLNVRQKPELTAKVVRTVKLDTKVSVYETKGDWSRIGTNEWASSNYLKNCPAASSTSTTTTSSSSTSTSTTSSSSTSTTTSSNGVKTPCVFPVKASGFSHLGDGLCVYRKPERSHGGQDFHTKSDGEVYAVYDGTITYTTTCYTNCETACKDGSDYRRMYGLLKCTKAGGTACVNSVYIYHQTIDRTLLYGEIDKLASGIAKGSSVKAGQKIGTARGCGMLHLEVYKGKVASNRQITPTQCKNGQMPGALLKPDGFAKDLKAMCKML